MSINQIIPLRCILFLLLYFVVCQKTDCQKTDKIITFRINEQLKANSLKLSELGFTDIDLIPLETNEKSLIPRITDIRFGDEFFLLQGYTTELKFKNDGSFKNIIGIKCRGPNEFTVIHDIDINEKDKRIYLVSGWQRRFFVYSENGTFIKTFQCPLNTTHFRNTADGILCYSINSFANITNSYNLVDSTGQIIGSFPKMYPFKAPRGRFLVFIFENLFYKYNNQLFKKEIYSDTIYAFEKSSFKPHAVNNQGKRLITQKVRSDLSPDQLSENYFQQLNLFEFGDYIYYEFLINGNLFGMLGSKKQNLAFIIDLKQGITNDLDVTPNIWRKAVKDYNTMVSWIDAIQLKTHVASEAFESSKPLYPEKKKELEKLAARLKVTDNPILVLIKFQK